MKPYRISTSAPELAAGRKAAEAFLREIDGMSPADRADRGVREERRIAEENLVFFSEYEQGERP